MLKTLKEACEAAAKCDDMAKAVGIVIDYCEMVDGGAYAYDFHEGWRRHSDCDWPDLDHDGRVACFMDDAANEVQADTFVIAESMGLGMDEEETRHVARACEWQMGRIRKMLKWIKATTAAVIPTVGGFMISFPHGKSGEMPVVQFQNDGTAVSVTMLGVADPNQVEGELREQLVTEARELSGLIIIASACGAI